MMTYMNSEIKYLHKSDAILSMRLLFRLDCIIRQGIG